MTRHILIVGFSLRDDNFHALIDEVRQAVHGRHNQNSAGASLPLGSVVILEDDKWLRDLWENDLKVIVIDDDHSAGAGLLLARRLELFLDYLLYLYSRTSSPRHLLDDSYETVLSADDLKVKKALLGLAAALSDIEKPERFTPLQQILTQFGGGYSC